MTSGILGTHGSVGLYKVSVNASKTMNIEPQNKEPQNFEGRYFTFLFIQQSVTRRKRLHCASESSLRHSKFLSIDHVFSVIRYSN